MYAHETARKQPREKKRSSSFYHSVGDQVRQRGTCKQADYLDMPEKGRMFEYMYRVQEKGDWDRKQTSKTRDWKMWGTGKTSVCM